MNETSYPLSWPTGWQRTATNSKKHGRFGQRDYRPGSSYKSAKDITVAVAIDRLNAELNSMGVPDYNTIISTNLELKNNGFPYSGQKQPKDSGAAVYWVDCGNRRCMAIDLYFLVEHNIAALAATLSAMRAIERHGGAAILDRAFTGFTALPGPSDAFADCWTVLGIAKTTSRETINAAYRLLARLHHPDCGGTQEKMSQINVARDVALKSCD
jgi:hypothetical protein